VRVEEQELSSHPLTEIDDTGVKLHREGEKRPSAGSELGPK